MIPPACHSNSFTDLYSGDSDTVCKMNVGNVAFNNHPGRTASHAAHGWRPWRMGMDVDGRNVEASQVATATSEHSFWLNDNGSNGSARITVSSAYSYEEDKRRYFISSLNGMTFNVQWDSNSLKWKKSGSHVFYIEPECDRLMLAQNVYFDSLGVYKDKAKVDWYRPRAASIFDPDEDTEVRPYRPPLVAVNGWENGVPPYASPDYGDWRYNPKKDFTNVPIHSPIDASSESFSRADCIELVRKAIEGNSSLEDMTAEWHMWPDLEQLIMLYGVRFKKVYRTEIIDGEPQKVFDHHAWSLLYWYKGAFATDPAIIWEDNIQEHKYAQLHRRLSGIDPYNMAWKVGDKTVMPILASDNHDFLYDLTVGSAFDLRLYCVRYNWKAYPIDNDQQSPNYGNPDKSQPPLRGYFNTKCFASVRQIAPVPPR